MVYLCISFSIDFPENNRKPAIGINAVLGNENENGQHEMKMKNLALLCLLNAGWDECVGSESGQSQPQRQRIGELFFQYFHTIFRCRNVEILISKILKSRFHVRTVPLSFKTVITLPFFINYNFPMKVFFFLIFLFVLHPHFPIFPSQIQQFFSFLLRFVFFFYSYNNTN